MSLAWICRDWRFLRFLLRFIGLVERFLLISREQRGPLVELYLVTVKIVDKLVHEAVKGYLERFGVPNPDQ